MVAPYASFTSLMHLITDLHEHPHPPIKLDEEHVDSLNSNISFFQDFLEVHHNTVDGGFEIRLADAAHAAEDLIETHIADRVPDFYGSLQRVIDGLDLIRREVTEMNQNEQSQVNSQPERHPAPSLTHRNHTTVGIEGAMIEILNKLTDGHFVFKIIAITGMAGIGKTTLARKVYGHPYIKVHFHVVAFAVIPMDYTTKQILIELLLSLRVAENTESLLEESITDLGMKLYMCLFDRRYLVILDNVHDLEVWQSLRSFCPSNKKGSRILITTRELTVASSISSHNVAMDLLDERKSWELFCERVFGKDSCPRELEDVGKKITRNCGGLPLTISVIGEHLAMSRRAQKYWEHVANNINSLVFSLIDEESLKKLTTSYTRLPVHLKPCFLYMAVFPEDEEIEAYKLIRLWVAEGFIKPISGKSLEEAAESYLNDLIGRSLILPSKFSRSGRLKRCKIHSFLRHFCIKKAVENKFIYLALKLEDLRAVENERRIVRCHMESEGGHSLPYYNVSRSRALRTFIFEGELSSLEDKKLLRVLAPVIGSSSFLLETLDVDQLVNIRYLDPSIPFLQDIYLPTSVCLLWNLQYLVFDVKLDRELPQEIWKMARLRGVKMQGLILPHPPTSEDKNIVMSNLQSAQTLLNFDFSTEAVERIPNVKKLKVRYDDPTVAPDEFLENISLLQKLESLGCFFDLPLVQPSYVRNVNFPSSLRELNFSHLCWEDVTTKIGSLPNLEALKLYHCEGSEWELVEGQFFELKFLKLSHCRSLRYFNAESTHFPCLESLVLERLDRLQGIDPAIGDIVNLRSIELNCCPDSAVVSAREMADEQYELANDWLQVKVRLLKESNLSESLISTYNFHVHHTRC